MAKILLTSEDFVKSVTSVSANLAGKFLLPSIREAQDVKLRGILGDDLLATLEHAVQVKHITTPYQHLLDRCQYFLAYSAIVEVMDKVSYKISNFGVGKSTDENLQVASQDEIAKQKFYYQSKADSCALDLQNWLLQNKEDYPDLTECQCNKISAHLHTSASCGIFLGGARGKVIGGKCCRRR